MDEEEDNRVVPAATQPKPDPMEELLARLKGQFGALLEEERELNGRALKELQHELAAVGERQSKLENQLLRVTQHANDAVDAALDLVKALPTAREVKRQRRWEGLTVGAPARILQALKGFNRKLYGQRQGNLERIAAVMGPEVELLQEQLDVLFKSTGTKMPEVDRGILNIGDAMGRPSVGAHGHDDSDPS